MEDTNSVSLELTNDNIRNLVYFIRSKQVMLDEDLAGLYQIETRTLNQAVKRNIKRFPEEFCFQLTDEENSHLKSQIVISKDGAQGHGGRRTNIYAFTEQGIAMLSAVLRSDIAITVSIHIMKAFVEMRHFIANNALLFEKISKVELKQLEYQKATDNKLDIIFKLISEQEESSQKVFYDGQIYDAFSFIVGLIEKATADIKLVDNYVDIDTLNILRRKSSGVMVTIYTLSNTKLNSKDVNNFNTQYPTLTVTYTQNFHDRFLILDNTVVYHIGASIKDAGKKCFAISLMEDSGFAQNIINRL
jgi:DNA-binding PadR family transcriptional regulator